MKQNAGIEENTSKRTKALSAIFLVAVVFSVFWQTAGHDFIIYDDPGYVTQNSVVKSGLNRQSIVWAFTTISHSNWHPLTWLSHMLDVELFGLNPAGHHLMNVLLHLANTLLLLALLKRDTGHWWRSLFVAILFALHPLHVESVAWVAERKDVLSTLFWLLVMLSYSHYVAGGSRTAYASALVFFALGLMAKPMLVTVPFILLLWDVWPLQRWIPGTVEGEPLSRLVLEKMPFLVLTMASCVITFYAQKQGGSIAAADTVPLFFRVLNAMISYWHYVAGMVWPSRLAVIYPLPANLHLVQGMLAGVALLTVTLAFLLLRYSALFLSVGWFWFLITLIPVIGLVQVGQQAMADRYTYVPLIGLFIIIAWTIPSLVQHFNVLRSILPFFGGLAIAALVTCTWLQLGFWKDSTTLFSHACSAVPDNYIALRMLGTALSQQGKYEEALRSFRRALDIVPNDGRTYVELGVMSVKRGRTAEALQYYQSALQIDPLSAIAHFNLANLLYKQGRFGEAFDHYRAVLRIRPDWKDVHGNLGAAYAEAGDLNAALLHYDEALSFDPGNADLLYQRGLALAMLGKLEESITSFQSALLLRPAFAEAHYNIGVAMVRLGHIDDARFHFTEALRIDPTLSVARQALDAAIKARE